LTQIERREARIRRIRSQLNQRTSPTQLGSLNNDELVALSEQSYAQYHVGKSQNEPVALPLFLQKNVGDPAIKVSNFYEVAPGVERALLCQDFIPKLKDHLLPRVKETLLSECNFSPLQKNPHSSPTTTESSAPGHLDCHGPDEEQSDCVLFQNDRIYSHRLIRFNYTTYDVRRDQDVANPGTTHCNVMLLSDPGVGTVETSGAFKLKFHPFRYARVLGIYHVNVIYVGRGMVDYNARRFDFMWVRWYEPPMAPIFDDLSGWNTWRLDRLSFFPVDHPGAFGFVDPADVLRGCHIIPRFSDGHKRADGSTVSKCAQDHNDWKAYYVARFVNLHLYYCRPSLMFDSFVDRDMLMRYHWGLGVGHSYASECQLKETKSAAQLGNDERATDNDLDDLLMQGSDAGCIVGGSLSKDPELESESDHDSEVGGDNPELCMEERENEDLGESSDDDSDEHGSELSDDLDNRSYGPGIAL
jgi:hypothetical protein